MKITKFSNLMDGSSFRGACVIRPDSRHLGAFTVLGLCLMLSACKKSQDARAVLIFGVYTDESIYIDMEGDFKISRQIGTGKFFVSLNSSLGTPIVSASGTLRPEDDKDVLRLTVKAEMPVAIRLKGMQGMRVEPVQYMNSLKGKDLHLAKGDHLIKISGNFVSLINVPNDA